MAYADFTDKIVRKVGGRFRFTAAEAVKAGDLITYDGYLADAEDSKPAAFVALEDVASSGTGWASVAAVIKKQPTTATGGGVTRGDHGGTAGTVLYLDGSTDEGEVCESAGTISQVCGYVLSQDEAILMPMQYLTGTNLSLSGTLGVTGATTLSSTLAVTGAATLSSTIEVTGAATLSSTLAVTGATTMTGALTANGGIAVAAEKTVGFTAKDYTSDGAITPKGLATLSANAADLAMTLAAPTVGDILVIHDKANSGTKNHVVSAKAASATFDGTNNTATFNATNECLVLLGISTTRWAILENIGSVGLSST